MASSFISAPGTQFGPCLDCQHTDCQGLRQIAESVCELCDQPIEYERRFIRSATRQTKYFHVVCFYRALADLERESSHAD